MQARRLREVCERRSDACGLYNSQCRMSELTPMKCEIEPGCSYLTAVQRRFSTEPIEFLIKKLDELTKLGIVEKCYNHMELRYSW